jgi:hypothetical protein
MRVSFALLYSLSAYGQSIFHWSICLGRPRGRICLRREGFNSYLESNTRPENDFRPMHIFPRTHAALRIDQLRYSSYRHGSGVGHQPSFAQGLEHE